MKQVKLCFASRNPNKLEEIHQIAGNGFHIVGLNEIGFMGDIPEPYPSLEENALNKVRQVYRHSPVDCFADDTGLEVYALNMEPGVRSARYAGEPVSNEANVKKLLKEMQGRGNRKARFRTVVALIYNGKEYTFEGSVEGHIAHSQSGSKGFGYDPVFIPIGYPVSFAQMEAEEKNRISHRRLAIQQMIDFLTARP